MKLKNKKLIAIFIFLILLSVGFPSAFSQAKKIEPLTEIAVPVIYPRSSWSNAKYEKRTKKIWPPKYENPEIIIIHHTATNYSSSTSKQIKKIYKYHSYTRKWGDIGYNYIIGKDGLIFQGRYGNNGVIGGHAYNSVEKVNYNSGSIGISILGNYEDEELSSAARDSLEKLVGWLAANNNISIKSDIKFHGKLLSNSVVGHRNVDDTDCPGKNIYKLMFDIRSNAEALAESYSNYAYQIFGESKKYEISGGKRYSGNARSSVATISKTQLEVYPLEKITESENKNYTYPSGTVVKVSAGNQKGIIENGILRTISSDNVFSSSYNSSNFVEISSEKWASYSLGAEASFRSGTFLKDENENYFIISGDQKRRLNLSVTDLILIDLSSAHSATEDELIKYTEGNAIENFVDFPENLLITSNYKTYYCISEGKKKKVSKNVFQATFSREMAIKVSKKFLKKYKTGRKLSFQDGAVVDYRGKYYFIENGIRRQFAVKNLAKRMGYQNIVKAKRTEMTGIGKGAKIE